MSEFLKRWSARKHQALQPREQADPEVVVIPTEGNGKDEMPDTELDSRVVSTDKRSGEPEAAEGLLYEVSEGKPAIDDAASQPARPIQPGKSALPDKETLRAMFRTHKPDGLDDYTQDFSQPELLPAALTAGLRNWLVETVTAPEAESGSALSPSDQASPEQALANQPAAAPSFSSPASQRSEPPAILPAPDPQAHTKDRDILVDEGGQNVPTKDGGMERLGS
ncbi:DUF3306 domain-containing protein [Aeromonas sp. CA23]|uniref:DUF3306 domain-containing protein n=1 Tax=Aeromonas sp. CA23 TaxID=2033032 RepID=UPI000BFCB06A|nr:DUF3306 domain-containing protein [Aeromonas sp. CA23]ATL99069.1 DUF3306 domain-containing protein [Aeromonas sp. CA23]